MQPQEHLQEIKILTDTINQLWVIIIPIFVLSLFRTVIDRMIQGILWHIGKNYEKDDIVMIDGDHARIVRTGILRTTFYIYQLDKDEKVVSGTLREVSNDQLRSMKIEKQLQQVEIPTTLRSIYKQ